jgi:putative phosphoesterase
MKIAVLSDTHGFFHPRLPEYLGDADLIVHAGDLGSTDVLDGLEALGPPVRAVFGNVDGQAVRGRTVEHERFEVEGLRFWMTHIGGRPGKWDHRVAEPLRADPPDVFICGHSHILRVERVDDLGGMLYLNPGAAGRHGLHQQKTCVRLQVENGAAREAEVVHLDE